MEEKFLSTEKIMLMIEILYKYYDKLSNLPKPEQTKIGGTYYGSTELFSSVGNQLEIDEDCCYTQYGYAGIKTNYTNAYIIRIGGAYNFSTTEIVKELVDVLGGRYDSDSRVGIIDVYGTNFSTVGFGVSKY